MLSICGVDCCEECSRKAQCGGCVKTDGHPFGGQCVAAECIKRGGFEAFASFKKTRKLQVQVGHPHDKNCSA